MSQFTIIYKYGKYGKRTRQLKFKRGLKKFPSQETMAAGGHCFAPELNEKEVIELLEDLSNILGAFLIKQLFHLSLLDMKQLWPTRRYVSRWLSIISYPTHARGIIVQYTPKIQLSVWVCFLLLQVIRSLRNDGRNDNTII